MAARRKSVPTQKEIDEMEKITDLVRNLSLDKPPSELSVEQSSLPGRVEDQMIEIPTIIEVARPRPLYRHDFDPRECTPDVYFPHIAARTRPPAIPPEMQESVFLPRRHRRHRDSFEKPPSRTEQVSQKQSQLSKIKPPESSHSAKPPLSAERTATKAMQSPYAGFRMKEGIKIATKVLPDTPKPVSPLMTMSPGTSRQSANVKQIIEKQLLDKQIEKHFERHLRPKATSEQKIKRELKELEKQVKYEKFEKRESFQKKDDKSKQGEQSTKQKHKKKSAKNEEKVEGRPSLVKTPKPTPTQKSIVKSGDAKSKEKGFKSTLMTEKPSKTTEKSSKLPVKSPKSTRRVVSGENYKSPEKGGGKGAKVTPKPSPSKLPPRASPMKLTRRISPSKLSQIASPSKTRTRGSAVRTSAKLPPSSAKVSTKPSPAKIAQKSSPGKLVSKPSASNKNPKSPTKHQVKASDKVVKSIWIRPKKSTLVITKEGIKHISRTSPQKTDIAGETSTLTRMARSAHTPPRIIHEMFPREHGYTPLQGQRLIRPPVPEETITRPSIGGGDQTIRYPHRGRSYHRGYPEPDEYFKLLDDSSDEEPPERRHK